jgi:hypothetical protein
LSTPFAASAVLSQTAAESEAVPTASAAASVVRRFFMLSSPVDVVAPFWGSRARRVAKPSLTES